MVDEMVNASKLMERYEKDVVDWLNTDTAELVLKNTAEHYECKESDLVATKGSDIYLHKDVALTFMMWLSPQFYIWSVKKIQLLIETGYAEMEEVIPDYQNE